MNKKYFYSFEGDHTRYELQEFICMIIGKRSVSYRLTPRESVSIEEVNDKFRSNKKIICVIIRTNLLGSMSSNLLLVVRGSNGIGLAIP